MHTAQTLLLLPPTCRLVKRLPPTSSACSCLQAASCRTSVSWFPASLSTAKLAAGPGMRVDGCPDAAGAAHGAARRLPLALRVCSCLRRLRGASEVSWLPSKCRLRS